MMAARSALSLRALLAPSLRALLALSLRAPFALSLRAPFALSLRARSALSLRAPFALSLRGAQRRSNLQLPSQPIQHTDATDTHGFLPPQPNPIRVHPCSSVSHSTHLVAHANSGSPSHVSPPSARTPARDTASPGSRARQHQQIRVHPRPIPALEIASGKERPRNDTLSRHA
jgi:hypothetical protein